MHIILALHGYLTLAVMVQAAPRRSGRLCSPLSTPEELLKTNLVIDPKTCNAERGIPKDFIETAVKDAYTLAQKAQSMPITHPAYVRNTYNLEFSSKTNHRIVKSFTNYFLATDEDDVKTVPKMYEAITTLRPEEKFLITCPTVKEFPNCEVDKV